MSLLKFLEKDHFDLDVTRIRLNNILYFYFLGWRFCTSLILTMVSEIISIFKFLVGVGKSSLVQLIVKGSSIARPPQTIGCTVGVKVRQNFPLCRSLWMCIEPSLNVFLIVNEAHNLQRFW